MLSDEKIIELMVSQPSWEDVLTRIVVEEGMDPWKIDIVRLADCFIQYLERMRILDLRIPARFILIAAILLRMKSEILRGEEEKKEEETRPASERTAEEIRQALEELAKVPPLPQPAERMPVRNVTLEELIIALRKAFEIRERRNLRKLRRKEAVGKLLEEEEDITERISTLLSKIKSILEELEKEEIEFSRLVEEWKREKIVNTLLPMLHLCQEGKLTYEQPELFSEIYVRLKENEQESVN